MPKSKTKKKVKYMEQYLSTMSNLPCGKVYYVKNKRALLKKLQLHQKVCIRCKKSTINLELDATIVPGMLPSQAYNEALRIHELNDKAREYYKI